MDPAVLLFFSAVFLLYSCEAKGSTVTSVIVQTGTDLLLDVKESVTLNEDNLFTWKYNGTINIVRVYGHNQPTIKKKGAKVFGNFSLLLKNVQQKDSGMYRAQISADQDRTVAEYEVTVQDPVSAVNLMVNCSSALNFTVTCSTVDSHISSTFRCDNKTCSRESSTTTDPSSIDVYLDQGFIFCNHSNHVSWEHKKEEIKSVCEPPPDSSAVTSVFVQTGTDLLLDVKEPVTLTEDNLFTWRHNGTINIVRVYGHNKPSIKKKGAEVFGNYSLLLKNVQQKDSGMYKAVIAAEEDKTVAEYEVTVQDPVSAVNLTVNCSSALNFTVTCSTVDSHISSTFRCDNKTCSRESSTTTDPPSIDVHLDQGFIICNHSNHMDYGKPVHEVPQVSSDFFAVTPVFVKKGDDLLLNVTEADVPKDFSMVAWKFRVDVLVTFAPDGKPKVYDDYIGRVETSVNKFSVKLKNLQEADSGVYTAQVTAKKQIPLAEYNVTVQGMSANMNTD
ncbi:hypothetical protein GBF38_016019, partial [Nibea albiflora]